MYLLSTEDGELYTTDTLTRKMRDHQEDGRLVIITFEQGDFRKVMDFKGPGASPRFETVDDVGDALDEEVEEDLNDDNEVDEDGDDE